MKDIYLKIIGKWSRSHRAENDGGLRKHLNQGLIYLLACLISVGSVFYSSSTEAALLALPSGESESLIWERALIVYDRLSEQQTVIGEVSITGSPSHFAILIATPQVAVIDYTTTRIWRKLKPYIQQKTTKTRRLQVTPYSAIWQLFKPNVTKSSRIQQKIDVLKSTDTQIHTKERALHEWLIRRGLSLTPEQALSIKKVYRDGLTLTTLHVKPRRRRDDVIIEQTWTSTWVFTHEVRDPHYLYLAPTSLALNTNQSAGHDHRENDEEPRARLKLSFISDQALIHQFDSSLNSPRQRINTKRATGPLQGVMKILSRLEISELNHALSTENWSFNRRGILTSFELEPPHGIQKIRGEEVESREIKPLDTLVKERLYVLSIPIELALLFFYIIYRGFKRRGRFRL